MDAKEGAQGGALVRVFREHRLLLHVIAPAAIGLSLIAAFFSGVPWLASAVAPLANREYGLLENAQLALLLVLVVLLAQAWRVERDARWRSALAVALFGTGFMAMEEADYGLHLIELLVGSSGPTAGLRIRNVHNVGDNTDRLKFVSDVATVLLFVVLPWVPALRRHGRMAALVPSGWYTATAAIILLCARLPHWLYEKGAGTLALRSNLSEFQEVLVYYAFALYLADLLVKRQQSLERGRPASARHAAESAGTYLPAPERSAAAAPPGAMSPPGSECGVERGASRRPASAADLAS